MSARPPGESITQMAEQFVHLSNDAGGKESLSGGVVQVARQAVVFSGQSKRLACL